MRRTEFERINRLLDRMALDETASEKIQRLVRNLPVDKKAKRTARIVAFRALRESKEKQIQDRLNGHFDFGGGDQ